jgi:TPR repeat protein
MGRRNALIVRMAGVLALLTLAFPRPVDAAPPPLGYVAQAQAALDPLSQALKDVSLQNYKAALPALQQYANTDQVKALFVLANLYLNGQGVEKSQEKAAELYRKAAGLGFSPAQYALGGLYENGWGVKADLASAMQWYGKAAAQDSPAACFRLGKLLMQRAQTAATSGGAAANPARDNAKDAFAWITHASQLGYPQAHYERGVMLWQGTGIERDKVEAYRWIVTAAQAGVPEARQLADQIVTSLSGMERSEALARVRTSWQTQQKSP